MIDGSNSPTSDDALVELPEPALEAVGEAGMPDLSIFDTPIMASPHELLNRLRSATSVVQCGRAPDPTRFEIRTSHFLSRYLDQMLVTRVGVGKQTPFVSGELNDTTRGIVRLIDQDHANGIQNSLFEMTLAELEAQVAGGQLDVSYASSIVGAMLAAERMVVAFPDEPSASPDLLDDLEHFAASVFGRFSLERSDDATVIDVEAREIESQ